MPDQVRVEPLDIDDLSGLCELMTDCIDHDGGLAAARSSSFVETRMLSGPGIKITASDGSIAAAIGVANRRNGVLPICGAVHRDHRRKGYGSELLEWALRVVGTRPAELWCESVTNEFDALVHRFNFASTFAELIMERPTTDLSFLDAIAGCTVASWATEHRSDFYSAWHEAFSDRPGRPNWTESQWLDAMTTDPGFNADASLVVLVEGRPVAFVLVESNSIDQIGVIAPFRRRGIARWLTMISVMAIGASGANHATLCVNENNPGAIALYEQCGFVCAGRRGRWSKPESK